MVDDSSPLARLAEAERRLAAAADAPADLKAVINRAIARYREPMRVAVVAQIKRGKSTLVNALLRERAPEDSAGFDHARSPAGSPTSSGSWTRSPTGVRRPSRMSWRI